MRWGRFSGKHALDTEWCCSNRKQALKQTSKGMKARCVLSAYDQQPSTKSRSLGLATTEREGLGERSGWAGRADQRLTPGQLRSRSPRSPSNLPQPRRKQARRQAQQATVLRAASESVRMGSTPGSADLRLHLRYRHNSNSTPLAPGTALSSTGQSPLCAQAQGPTAEQRCNGSGPWGGTAHGQRTPCKFHPTFNTQGWPQAAAPSLPLAQMPRC